MIPVGLCQCGCGTQTKINKGTRPRRDLVHGQYFRYAPGHNPRKSRLIRERFMEKIQQTEMCWIWTGLVSPNGYGRFFVNRRIGMMHAHRVAWIVFFRFIPNGFHVLHRCDNKLCVNPEHLWLGSREDNMKDMVEKGRSQRGSRHWKAKLKEDDVSSIRERYAAGETQDAIAQSQPVGQAMISRIVRRENWRHVGK